MAASAAMTEKKAAPPKRVRITLLHREPSGYKWKHNDQIIDYPKHKNILVEDRCDLSKELVDYYNWLTGKESLKVTEAGVVETPDGIVIGNLGDRVMKRRIKGVSTIWKTEQESRKLVPTLDDSIWLENGDLEIDFGQDKGKYLHVMMHNQLDDFPFKDDSIGEACLKIDDHQQQALSGIEQEDLIEQASDIVKMARDPQSKKILADKIAFYANVFKKQIGHLETDEEKYITLLNIAKLDPKVIINGVHSETVDYYATINAAMGFQILVRDNNRVINTLTSNEVVKLRKGATQNHVAEALVEYYSSKIGAAEFEHLKNTVNAHQKELVS